MIIIDCNNVCCIQLFKMSTLSWDEIDTNVIFGFLREILVLAEKFNSRDLVFCWDSGKSFRKQIDPEYKGNRRKDQTEEQKVLWQSGFKQMDLLRESILPKLGFVNSFLQVGIEADDLIAVICEDYKEEPTNVIVSTDNDLYQLLRFSNCCVYNPISKSSLTESMFYKKYYVSPSEWSLVKSIAGCSGDNIKGVKGVGEVTAISYVNHRLAEHHVKYKEIEGNKKLIENNLRLVKLPFYKTKKIKVMPYKFNVDGFDQVCFDLNFKSFLNKDYYLRWRNMFFWGK